MWWLRYSLTWTWLKGPKEPKSFTDRNQHEYKRSVSGFPVRWNMDVKPPNVQIPIRDLTPYQRPVRILHRPTLPLLLVFTDNIIDCVEIETGKHSAANTQIVSYKSLSSHPIKSKGTYIDIRVWYLYPYCNVQHCDVEDLVGWLPI